MSSLFYIWITLNSLVFVYINTKWLQNHLSWKWRKYNETEFPSCNFQNVEKNLSETKIKFYFDVEKNILGMMTLKNLTHIANPNQHNAWVSCFSIFGLFKPFDECIKAQFSQCMRYTSFQYEYLISIRVSYVNFRWLHFPRISIYFCFHFLFRQLFRYICLLVLYRELLNLKNSCLSLSLFYCRKRCR